MIIYKYQYEKECVLKKTHGYWCLNNCSVREMERGGKMWIIFFHYVCRGKKHLIEHIPWGTNSEVEDKMQKRHFYDFFFLFVGWTKPQINMNLAALWPVSVPVLFGKKKETKRAMKQQIIIFRSAFSTLLFLVYLSIRCCICISNIHIWIEWFKCQHENWWQSKAKINK